MNACGSHRQSGDEALERARGVHHGGEASSGDAGAASGGGGSCRRIDLLEQAPGKAFDQGKVFRAVVFADAVAIIAEAEIQVPVQVVLDQPVAVDPFPRPLRAIPPGVEAGYAVTDLDAPLSGFEVESFALDADNAPQVDPVGVTLAQAVKLFVGPDLIAVFIHRDLTQKQAVGSVPTGSGINPVQGMLVPATATGAGV